MSKLKSLIDKADLRTTHSFLYICSTLERDPLLKSTIVSDVCDGRVCSKCILSMHQFGKLEYIKVKHE